MKKMKKMKKMKNLDRITISEISVGTWFNVESESIKNSYKLIGECTPGLYACECGNKLVEFPSSTVIKKIDGFQLYLLEGGRDWD